MVPETVSESRIAEVVRQGEFKVVAAANKTYIRFLGGRQIMIHGTDAVAIERTKDVLLRLLERTLVRLHACRSIAVARGITRSWLTCTSVWCSPRQYPTREILLAAYDGDVDLVNTGRLVCTRQNDHLHGYRTDTQFLYSSNHNRASCHAHLRVILWTTAWIFGCAGSRWSS